MLYSALPNHTPAITWDAIARILPAGGQNGIKKFYHNPRIYFWNQPVGVRLVCDSATSGGSIPGRNTMVSMGANWSPICGPSIGVSANVGNVFYIAYSAAKLSVPFGNQWYDSDFMVKFTIGGGITWQSYPPFPDNINDDRFTFINKKTYGGFLSFALIMQKDRFPGSFRMGDTTQITRAYPEFFLFIPLVNHRAQKPMTCAQIIQIRLTAQPILNTGLTTRRMLRLLFTMCWGGRLQLL
jgi:hypothetical protein